MDCSSGFSSPVCLSVTWRTVICAFKILPNSSTNNIAPFSAGLRALANTIFLNESNCAFSGTIRTGHEAVSITAEVLLPNTNSLKAETLLLPPITISQGSRFSIVSARFPGVLVHVIRGRVSLPNFSFNFSSNSLSLSLAVSSSAV